MNKIFVLSLLMLFSVFGAFAQFEGQVSWTQEVSARADGQVAITFTATIGPGLHLYAAQQPEGSFALPTSLELDESQSGVELVGELKDHGKKITSFDEIMQVNQSYFHKVATFVQVVTVSGNNSVLVGELTYQVCDDEKCVPYFDKIEIDLSDYVK